MKYEINKENLIKAFIKLKAHFFYNSDPMFMKTKIVEFEKDIDRNIENLLKLYRNNSLDSIITSIRYHLIPKKEAANKKENVISIDTINFFIDAPIEFHLLDIIWIFNILEENYKDFDSQYIYGNKLKSSISYSEDKLSTRFIFENYNVKYNDWKNQCFWYASRLNESHNIEIYNFDLKQYYYNQKIDFDVFFEEYGYCNCNRINSFIKKCYCYYDTLVNEKKRGHILNKSMLIIGSISSAIISNYSLMKLDKSLYQKENVVYYGRYVDDILIVKINDEQLQEKINFLNKSRAFDKLRKWIPELVNCDSESNEKIMVDIFLPINIEKMNYYYFGHNKYNNSRFKDEIKEKIFCSNELVQSESELDNYDTWSLGHNLLKSLRKLLFNVDKTINDMSEKIDSLVNEIMDEYITINFRNIWKDILYYFRDNAGIQKKFYNKCLEDIELISQVNEKNNIYGKPNSRDNIINIKESLKTELKIALEWASNEGDLSEFYYNNFKFNEIERFIKQLLNNHLNDNCYDYFRYYPINIKMEELLPIALLEFPDKDLIELYKVCKRIFFEVNQFEYNKFVSINKNTSNNKLQFLKCRDFYIKYRNKRKFSPSFSVAIANVNFSKKEIVDSMLSGNPIFKTSFINSLILEASKNKANYIVFPEFCIQKKQIFDIQRYAKSKEITIISGITATANSGIAKNYIWIYDYALNVSLIREKNYYPPEEVMTYLENNYMVNIPTTRYYIIDNGHIRYSAFLCYEITNICDRANMRDLIDVVFMPVYNRDTHYFSSIIKSFSRDVSIFIVQSNINSLGDSRINAPYKSDFSNIMCIKGGINNFISIDKIDLNMVKQYQRYERIVERVLKSKISNIDKVTMIKKIRIKYHIDCPNATGHKDLIVAKPRSA